MTENQRVIQKHIDQRHNNSIDCQHLCPGNSNIQRTKHDINEREEETEHAPIQKFTGIFINRIRRNQHSHYCRSHPLTQTEQNGSQYQQEHPSLDYNRTNILATAFSITTANHYLRTRAETKSNGKNTDVKQSSHSGSSQFHLTDMSQESGIGYIYHILRQQRQQNRITYFPNILVCIHI